MDDTIQPLWDDEDYVNVLDPSLLEIYQSHVKAALYNPEYENRIDSIEIWNALCHSPEDAAFSRYSFPI